MPVKINPLILEELAALNLTLWEAKHPRTPFVNKAGKMSSREDKSWVLISLAGPGVTQECRAGAATLRQAVDSGLAYYFADRVPGIKGAMLKLEKALLELNVSVRWERLMAEDGYTGDRDDFIPF